MLSGKITANKSLTGYYRFTGKFLGHNFLNLNDSRLLVGSVSNIILHKRKTKKAFYSSHTWWNLKLWSHRQFNETFVHSCLASGMLTESTTFGIMPFLSMNWTLKILSMESVSMNLPMNQWFRWLWQVHRLHYVDLLNRCGTRWYIFQRLVRVFQNCSNVGTSECSVTSNSLSMNSLEILSMKSVSMICQWINDLMNEKKSSMKRL